MNIAKGSLGELFDSVDEALAKQYVTARERDRLNALIDRALRSANGLYNYLKGSDTPGAEC